MEQAARFFQRRGGLFQFLEGRQRHTGLGRAAQHAGLLVHQADQHHVEADRFLDAVRHFFQRLDQAPPFAEERAQLKDAPHLFGTLAQTFVERAQLLVAARVAKRDGRLVGQRHRKICRAPIKGFALRAEKVQNAHGLLAERYRHHQRRARCLGTRLKFAGGVIFHHQHIVALDDGALHRR